MTPPRSARREARTSRTPESRAVPLVFCFDANFAAFATTAIASALSNADAFYRVYCLFSGEDDQFPQQLRALAQRYRCELVQVPVPKESFAEWRIDAGRHFSPANYYRLLIPELIPEDRLIYLDCDLLVTCGLSDLYAHDLEGNWLGACRDPKGGQTTQMPLAPGEPYVNSGVLLLDAKALREHRPMPVIVDYYKRFEAGVTWVDQCLINKFAEGRKAILPDRWNVQFNQIEAEQIDAVVDRFDRQAVFHFSGPIKPWMEWAPSRLVKLWAESARVAGYDAASLTQRATTVGQLSSLAAKQEAEGEWAAAAATWKTIANILSAHLQRAA